MQAHIRRREKETGRKNPIFTNLNWHGHGGGPFKTSQQAYDTLHIGSIEGREGAAGGREGTARDRDAARREGEVRDEPMASVSAWSAAVPSATCMPVSTRTCRASSSSGSATSWRSVLEPAGRRRRAVVHGRPRDVRADRGLRPGAGPVVASIATGGYEYGSDHYEPTLQALEAGCHVLCEKPICNDIGKAEEWCAMARERGPLLRRRLQPPVHARRTAGEAVARRGTPRATCCS